MKSDQKMLYKHKKQKIKFDFIMPIACGLFFIFDIAPDAYFNKVIYFRSAVHDFSFGLDNIVAAICFVLLGLYCIWLGIIDYKRKKDEVYYLKCPRCKKSFSNFELHDEMCPYCDIRTIDIENYLKFFPDDRKYFGIPNEEIDKFSDFKKEKLIKQYEKRIKELEADGIDIYEYDEDEVYYLKCPKCRRSFSKSGLYDEICPYCEIKLIDTRAKDEKYE